MKIESVCERQENNLSTAAHISGAQLSREQSGAKVQTGGKYNITLDQLRRSLHLVE